ncbi:F-box only protein 13 [Salvia miltiorrhiza]|uniref:F-box only protein 13 n=1 Tax=Salvia miltiorrhiza TaxID=226208 RepID=UPI0025ABB4F2|nr:F-box only protein 13 [Salvia miltiorrhiza]
MDVSRKRKISEMCEGDESPRFPLNDLNQDLLERVLSWLPTSSFLRLTSVCKRWKSVANSAAFMLACSQVPARRPWFFMVDSHSSQQPVVFDSADGNWKNLNTPPPCPDSAPVTPVAAAGGLLCFLRPDGGFVVTNPVTGSCRRLAPPSPPSQQPMQAIAMASKREGFKLVLVSGELPTLKFREYCSITRQWGEEISLARSAAAEAAAEECSPYFLSKCGNVVSTHIQRSPSKQYSSILIEGDSSGEMLYFLSSGGTVVACDLSRRSFSEYPRLLPVFSEYSIDLVECGGRMCVVLLSEFLETASLRVWGWDEGRRSWTQTAAMPPWMSHKLYGKKADVNCTGGGGKMLVCVNSGEICRYVMCDLGENEWAELPQCSVDGRRREFVSALSFEPRIEVDSIL